MEGIRWDSELHKVQAAMPFLWNNYGFHLTYFTRDCGMYSWGFVVGLENDICKLVFEKETNSESEPVKKYVGKKYASFVPENFMYFPEDGWYTLPGLLYWVTGVECERDNDVEKDLQLVSQYLERYLENLLDLYKYPDEFDKKIEHYRTTFKDRQITVDKIRDERARLQSLGQDSSLEAAINSLRGGRK